MQCIVRQINERMAKILKENHLQHAFELGLKSLVV